MHIWSRSRPPAASEVGHEACSFAAAGAFVVFFFMERSEDDVRGRQNQGEGGEWLTTATACSHVVGRVLSGVCVTIDIISSVKVGYEKAWLKCGNGFEARTLHSFPLLVSASSFLSYPSCHEPVSRPRQGGVHCFRSILARTSAVHGRF